MVGPRLGRRFLAASFDLLHAGHSRRRHCDWSRHAHSQLQTTSRLRRPAGPAGHTLVEEYIAGY